MSSGSAKPQGGNQNRKTVEGKTQIFQHMNNNFMGGGSGPLQNGVSGVGIGGQKAAYGYVGGVNGQGLNTVNGSSSNKKNNFGSKGNLHAIQI